jgi:uncharacterized protein
VTGTHGAAGRVHVLRLAPGADVRQSLLDWCTIEEVSAACIIGSVGSLSAASLRMAGADTGTCITGDLELITLQGLLSVDGIHLHALVADDAGAIKGGHVLSGCCVRTTLEVVVMEIDGLRMERRHDETTGYQELFPVNC